MLRIARAFCIRQCVAHALFPTLDFDAAQVYPNSPSGSEELHDKRGAGEYDEPDPEVVNSVVVIGQTSLTQAK